MKGREVHTGSQGRLLHSHVIGKHLDEAGGTFGFGIDDAIAKLDGIIAKCHLACI